MSDTHVHRAPFKFLCSSCSAEHVGMPTFGFSYPIQYMHVPEDERSTRVHLTSDTCVIDDAHFFARGCIEIPVHESDESFIWGAWVSLSEKNFSAFQDLLDVEARAHHGPYFGWLCSAPLPYPDSSNLKTMLHLRDNGIRPRIVLEPTMHPLAVEQRDGISVERVAEIYAMMVHGAKRRDEGRP